MPPARSSVICRDRQVQRRTAGEYCRKHEIPCAIDLVAADTLGCARIAAYQRFHERAVFAVYLPRAVSQIERKVQQSHR